MQLINGYKFPSLEAGITAMNSLNTHWGLPVENGVSQFGAGSLNSHSDGFYWIHYNEWTSFLGTPEEIELHSFNI